MNYVLLIVLFLVVLYYEYDQNSRLQDKISVLQAQAGALNEAADKSAEKAARAEKRLSEVLARPQISLPAPVMEIPAPPAPMPPPAPVAKEIPVSVHELTGLFDRPDNLSADLPLSEIDNYTGPLTFNHANMQIQADARFGKITDITVIRAEAFNPLEVANLLKLFSPEEQWTQVDSNDWTLPGEKAKAHWDGESRLMVQ